MNETTAWLLSVVGMTGSSTVTSMFGARPQFIKSTASAGQKIGSQ